MISLPKIFNRKILVALLLVVAFLLLFSPKSAQAVMQHLPGQAPGEGIQPWFEPSQLRFEQTLFESGKTGDIFLESWVFKVFSDTGYTIAISAVGPITGAEGETTSGGAAGALARLTDNMYQSPPVSSTQYLADLSQNLGLGIVKPAYAQGKGWYVLEPVLKIWKIMRNLAYLFFVVAFVFIGFMIMFRAKIDPQTVASIQNSLPRIIMALILVTFSYAISGLIIDIIYLGNALMTFAFKPEFVTGGATPTATWMENFWIIDVLTSFQGRSFDVVANLLNGLKAILNLFTVRDPSVIFNLVIAITILGSIFRIFLALLIRYVMLFIYTIVSPFAFLWGALPGQQDTVSKFFLGFFSAALSFPAILFMVNLALYMSTLAATPGQANFEGIPPFDPSITGQPQAQINLGQVLGNFIALGILIGASKAPEMIDDALKVRPVTAAAAGAEITGALRRLPLVGQIVG